MYGYHYGNNLAHFFELKQIVNQKTELLNLRMEINDYISTNMVPSNILSKVSIFFQIEKTNRLIYL